MTFNRMSLQHRKWYVSGLRCTIQNLFQKAWKFMFGWSFLEYNITILLHSWRKACPCLSLPSHSSLWPALKSTWTWHTGTNTTQIGWYKVTAVHLVFSFKTSFKFLFLFRQMTCKKKENFSVKKRNFKATYGDYWWIAIPQQCLTSIKRQAVFFCFVFFATRFPSPHWRSGTKQFLNLLVCLHSPTQAR